MKRSLSLSGALRSPDGAPRVRQLSFLSPRGDGADSRSESALHTCDLAKAPSSCRPMYPSRVAARGKADSAADFGELGRRLRGLLHRRAELNQHSKWIQF
jgi:hypothetical protein